MLKKLVDNKADVEHLARVQMRLDDMEETIRAIRWFIERLRLIGDRLIIKARLKKD